MLILSLCLTILVSLTTCASVLIPKSPEGQSLKLNFGQFDTLINCEQEFRKESPTSYQSDSPWSNNGNGNVTFSPKTVATKTQKRKLYRLEDPVWFSKAGFNKGINHDRQHLGIILNGGTQIQIRVVQGDPSVQLKFRALNANGETEQVHNFGTEWLTVGIEFTSVPFIDTPWLTSHEEDFIVEYVYEATSKILPVYQKHYPHSNFFASWDNQNAEFALIESDYTNILVPQGDKEFLRQLSINYLIDFYDRIFTFFNELVGISFEPEVETDRNIPNRYFIKADATGPGAAYYSSTWTAESTSSIEDFWLIDHARNWGALHEIGHGYQGTFMGTPGFGVGEVWNNFYAAAFQNEYLGEKIWTEGWLYDYGNSERVFEVLLGYLADGTPLDKWDLRSKLNFLMLLELEGKDGKKAFTHFNQEYRKQANALHFDPDRFTLLDRLSESFSKIAKVDLTPTIQRVGGILSEEQIQRNWFAHERALYPICELVKKEDLPEILSALKLRNPLTLVDSSQLKSLGLLGDLNVIIDIEDFTQIYGETLILMEGQRYALKVKITERRMVINSIPVGVYTVILPTGKSIKYGVQNHYVVIKQGLMATLQINYRVKSSSSLVSQGFNFLGLSDERFASVNIDYEFQIIRFKVIREEPHYYFEGQLYAQLTIKKADGTVAYDKEIYGTNGTLSSDEIPFEPGYQVILYHREPRNRLVPAIRTEPSILTPSANSNTLLITTTGVINVATGGNPEYVRNRLAIGGAEIRNNSRILRSKYDSRKDNIYVTIANYPEPDRSILMEEYKDVLPSDNQIPGLHVGSSFLFNFRGIGDGEFCVVQVDFLKSQIHFIRHSVTPHNYFTNNYASIKFLDAHGTELFHHDFIGDQQQIRANNSFPISHFGGEKLYIHHKEPTNRLVLTNEMQDKRVLALRNNVYSFTQNGIKVLAESSDEEYDPPALYSVI